MAKNILLMSGHFSKNSFNKALLDAYVRFRRFTQLIGPYSREKHIVAQQFFEGIVWVIGTYKWI